ncbi:hypothetical protein THAOC_15123, partial [Thalassiosira oceanica]
MSPLSHLVRITFGMMSGRIGGGGGGRGPSLHGGAGEECSGEESILAKARSATRREQKRMKSCQNEANDLQFACELSGGGGKLLRNDEQKKKPRKRSARLKASSDDDAEPPNDKVDEEDEFHFEPEVEEREADSKAESICEVDEFVPAEPVAKLFHTGMNVSKNMDEMSYENRMKLPSISASYRFSSPPARSTELTPQQLSLLNAAKEELLNHDAAKLPRNKMLVNALLYMLPQLRSGDAMTLAAVFTTIGTSLT